MTPKDLNMAFRNFLLAFSRPSSMVACPVFLGFPERASLPPTKDFIVFYKLFKKRLSMGTDFFEAVSADEPGIWTAVSLYDITYQVDAYGYAGESRLENIKTIFESGIGAGFFRASKDKFNPRGLGVSKVGEIKNSTDKDGTPEYAIRYIVELTVSARLTAHVEQDWMDKLEITLKGVQ